MIINDGVLALSNDVFIFEDSVIFMKGLVIEVVVFILFCINFFKLIIDVVLFVSRI